MPLLSRAWRVHECLQVGDFLVGPLQRVRPDDEQSCRLVHSTHTPSASAYNPAAQRDTVTFSMPTTAVSMSKTVSVKVPVIRSGNTHSPS